MLSESGKYLEKAFKVFNQTYFEGKLPEVVLTIQSSPKCYGYITTRQVWTEREEKGSYYEINLSAEYLSREYDEVCATLLHEMVHLYCLVNGIRDTSNRGRYHNRRFQTEAEKRGLSVEYAPQIGYSVTSATDNLRALLKEQGLGTSLLYSRVKTEKAQKGKSSTRKYICRSCGMSIRATKKVHVICGDCMQPLVEV